MCIELEFGVETFLSGCGILHVIHMTWTSFVDVTLM